MNRRSYSSGYTNVDIIGNEDLFPNEGYEFPPNQIKNTRNYRTSTLFPLNTAINSQAIDTTTKMRSRDLGDLRPPTPIEDKPMPKVRSHRSKIIYETMINTRGKQVKYNEKLREYEREQGDVAASLDDIELQICRTKAQEERDQKKHNMKMLSLAYQQQLQEVENRKKREREIEQAYENQLKLEDEKLREEERKKNERLKQIQRERREEFEKKNEELQKSRQLRHQMEREEEKRIQQEAAEIELRKEERAKEDERRRLEMTKIRSRVVDQQAKNLKNLQQQVDTHQALAESEASKNALREVQATKEKHEKMEKDRHSEWLKLQKEKQIKNRHVVKRPFPSKQKEADELEFAEQQRQRENKSYRAVQEKQHQERIAQERREKEEELIEDQRMIEESQKKFEKSLQTLQKLVPEELGITVPKYNPIRSFSNP